MLKIGLHDSSASCNRTLLSHAGALFNASCTTFDLADAAVDAWLKSALSIS